MPIVELDKLSLEKVKLMPQVTWLISSGEESSL